MVASDSREIREQDGTIHRDRPNHEERALDDTIGALIDDRCRYTLQYVVSTDGPVGFDELVEHLVDSATWATPRGTDSNHVALRLYHVVLPKLADADLLEYDREKNLVEATEYGGELGTLFR